VTLSTLEWFGKMSSSVEPTPVYVKRIAKRLEDLFKDHIDVSDMSNCPTQEAKHCFLQRALAAYTLVCSDVADPIAAASSITDGGNDGGIDAIFIDDSSSTVYLVQSKWTPDGKKTIDESAALKFMQGVGRILHEEWNDFNDRIQSKIPELEAAVADSRTCFVAVAASPSEKLLESHAQRTINDGLKEFNGPVEPFVHFEAFDVQRLYRSLFRSIGPSNIDLTITLLEWAVVTKPYLAYYGQIEVGDLLDWKIHGSALFERNLRNFQRTFRITGFEFRRISAGLSG
jgi:hypothetical protein